MFNPLALFSERLLEALVQAGKLYFVRQTYPRGREPFNEEQKGAFLITHYAEMGPAATHYDAIAHDTGRYLYRWDKEADREKLKRAASQPSGYSIYAGVFLKDWEKNITDRVKNCIRYYVAAQGWKPGRNEIVQPDFYLEFGELHVKIKFRNLERKLKFDEIEKPF